MDILTYIDRIEDLYGNVLPRRKPPRPIADQYQDYKQVQEYFEPRTQMYIEKEMGFDDGGRVGFASGTPRLPITSKEQKIANIQYGKNMEDLSKDQRSVIRKRISSGKVDTITFEQYLQDYKDMANNPDYKPKYVKPNVGTGMSPQQLRARVEAKKTVEGFESKFLKNVSRRKSIKKKAAIEADPERKQIEMAKKAERRRQRRTEKLEGKTSLTQKEKLLNFEQSLITRQLNDKIKANPNIILKNKKLIDQLSITVDRDGNIIKSKPTIYELEKRGLFEIEHQRDVRKAGAMKDFPYNRNPILGPYNRAGGFKDMAEKFIEKNPDPNNPKVKNIIKKAEELKITLQPEVPKGTFKTKGIGYKQPTNATGKFVDYAKSYLPELVDDKIGMAGYTGDREMLERGLKATRKIGIKPTDTKPTILSKIKKAPIPNKLKGPLLAAVGTAGAIKGADLFTGSAMADTGVQQADSVLPEAAAGAGAVGAYKARKPIWKGIKTAGKIAGKTLAPLAVPLEAGYVLRDLKSGSSVPEALLDVVMLGGLERQRQKRNFIKNKYGDEVYSQLQSYKSFGDDGMGIPQELPERFKKIEAEANQFLQAQRTERAAEFERKSNMPMPEIDAFAASNGGLASLTRTVAPPRGPQYRGLDYLKYYGR